jgi:hypothetical protein
VTAPTIHNTRPVFAYELVAGSIIRRHGRFVAVASTEPGRRDSRLLRIDFADGTATTVQPAETFWLAGNGSEPQT